MLLIYIAEKGVSFGIQLIVVRCLVYYAVKWTI